jgi:hypothetical protein
MTSTTRTAPVDDALSDQSTSHDLLILTSMVAHLSEVLAAGLRGGDHRYVVDSTGQRRRLLIYRPEVLRDTRPLALVGFVSQLRERVDTRYVRQLQRTDAQLTRQLAQRPGLVSYYSRELLPGRWCNLVLFCDQRATLELRDVPAHRRAAHVLAPQTYAWIRLHAGTLPDGVRSRRIDVQSTRYYTYQPETGGFAVRVVSHR